MTGSNISATFPCPGCGQVLTIHNVTAMGPCPYCQISIKMDLKISLAEQNENQDQDLPKRKLRFDKRALRANETTAPLERKPYHPPSDWR